jgi:DNA-binding response OmpR family regulator
VEGFRLGGVDFISKPFQPEELLSRVRTHLELSRLRTRLEAQVAERTAQLYKSTEELKQSLERLHNSMGGIIRAMSLSKLD